MGVLDFSGDAGLEVLSPNFQPTQGFWDLNQAGYEGPLYAPQPWDTIVIGGFQIPGLIQVKSGSISKKLDIQKPHGRDGGAIIERGIEPGKFDVDVVIWTPEQWTKWQEIRPQIYRRVGKLAVNDRSRKTNPVTNAQVALAEAAALTIAHPALNSLDINRAIIASITVPVPGTDVGTIGFTISFIEFIPPSAKVTARKIKGLDAPKVNSSIKDRPTVNKPASPRTTDAGPNGPPRTPSQAGH